MIKEPFKKLKFDPPEVRYRLTGGTDLIEAFLVHEEHKRYYVVGWWEDGKPIRVGKVDYIHVWYPTFEEAQSAKLHYIRTCRQHAIARANAYGERIAELLERTAPEPKTYLPERDH